MVVEVGEREMDGVVLHLSFEPVKLALSRYRNANPVPIKFQVNGLQLKDCFGTCQKYQLLRIL